jgi:hypothetical protein
MFRALLLLTLGFGFLRAAFAPAPGLAMTYLGEHRRAVEAEMLGLPKRGQDVPFGIVEVTPGKGAASYLMGDEFTGLEMSNSPDLLFVLWDDEARETVAHEFAHHVYGSVLSPAERHDWNAYWGRHLSWMPLRAAHENPNEGFAYCYEWTYASKDAWRHRREVAPVLAELLHDERGEIRRDHVPEGRPDHRKDRLERAARRDRPRLDRPHRPGR